MIDGDEFSLVQHLRPVHLLTALALYLTGAGLARYLGVSLDPGLICLDLLWLLCLLVGFFFLGDYFEVPFIVPVLPVGESKPDHPSAGQTLGKDVLLYAALALLTSSAVLTILLLAEKSSGPLIWGLMLCYFALLAVRVVPGLALESSGLGEFIASICLVVFPPGLAFFSLSEGLHRFLSLAVFPLFPLHLALLMTLQLRSYPVDLRMQRKTLLVRIGWKKGVFLHNLLVLSGFVLFGAALLFGLPIRIGGPVFTALIPGGYLIWYYTGLERGAPVRWKQILYLSLAVLLIPIYYLLFASWIY